MKKLSTLILVMIITLVCLTACIDDNPNGNDGSSSGNVTASGNASGDVSSSGNVPSDNVSSGNVPSGSISGDAPSGNASDTQITKMYITINSNKLEVTLTKNSSVDALVEKLKQGDITYTANDYGDFEKVGSLGFSLPTNNEPITTEPGDVILYLGNQLVLFYGSNYWSAYTRIGKINGYSAEQLAVLLCSGKNNLQVTLSLK